MSSQVVEAPVSKESLAAAVGFLKSREGTQDFFEGLLGVASDHMQGQVTRVDYREGVELKAVTQHRQPMTEALSLRFSTEYLAPLVKTVLEEERTDVVVKRYTRQNQHINLLCAPVTMAGTIVGTLSVLTTVRDPARVQTTELQLEGLAAVASAALPQTKVTESMPPRDVKSVAAASRFSSAAEFAYSLVNQLCSQLQAEVVSLGVERSDRVEVAAVSGSAEIRKNSPGVSALSQLMAECLDHREPVTAQEVDGNGSACLPIHRQYSAERQNANVCSVPLVCEDEIAGIITIQRAASRPFSQEDIAALSGSLQSYGTAIRVLEKANRSLGSHVAEASRKLATKSPWRIAVMAGCAALVAWLGFGTLTYKPLCRTRVIAADMQHFAAPVGGKLSKVLVRPGQAVESGQVLVEFDATELRMKLNVLDREISAKRIEMHQALNERDLQTAALKQAELRVLATKASSVRRRIEDSRIVATKPGTVILADLHRRVGQAFQQGDELLQVAQEGDWTLEIEVPDKIISYVQTSQKGTFAAKALPATKQSFEIAHLDGAARVVEDRNVFVARATMTERPEWMRSGMEGTSKIETVPRPVWWVFGHSAVDWVQSHFWL